MLQNGLFFVARRWRCHQMTTRSFVVTGRQMPLCSRCLGILLGGLLSPVVIAFLPISTQVCFLGIALFVMDGGTQFVALRESRNWLRLATGSSFSVSIAALIWRGVHGI